MKSSFTVEDGPYEKYEYPKSPFNSAGEACEAHNALKALVVPAIWDGRRIIPCEYYPMHDQVAAEAISNYYYDVGEMFRLAGSATVLIDETDVDRGYIRLTHIYPYADHDPIHEHVVRVVHESWLPLKVEKVYAGDGYVFNRFFANAVPVEKLREYLGHKFGDRVQLRLEIVDKAPDMKEEICNDVLLKEIQEEIDRATIEDIVRQLNNVKPEQ